MTVMAAIRPYPANVNGQPRLLFAAHEDRVAYLDEHPDALLSNLGLLAIAYFHDPAYRDYEYIAASEIDDTGEEKWTRDFGLRAMMVWMVNFARDEEERTTLHLANREHGSFRGRYGWQPDVMIEDQPTESEIEGFINHECQDLDRSPGMPIEFFEGSD